MSSPTKTKPFKEVQEELVANMKSWMKVENAAVASTGRVIEKTENPIIRLVMEIIQRDSQMHYRVQEWIADTLGGKVVAITPDEIAEVWGMLEEHITLEQRTLELARESLASIGDSKGMLVQAFLLEYLLDDEKKHNDLLDRLVNIQKGMYPYA